MPTDSPDQRLSRLQTHWNLVAQAHDRDNESARRRRGVLLQRYLQPAFRYLLAATGDQDLAEELCQEFALKFVQGDFRGADPTKGRFRDYLKTAMANLLREHYRKQQTRLAAWGEKEPGVAIKESPVESNRISPDFTACWREDLLSRVWEALASANTNYYTVLLARVENLDASSRELAEQLAVLLGQQVTADWVRKTQERAHKKFAHLLVEQVLASLEDPSQAAVEQELQQLDLLRYCRSAVERRFSPARFKP